MLSNQLMKGAVLNTNKHTTTICSSASTSFMDNSPTTDSVNLLMLGLTSELLSALELDKGYLKVPLKIFDTCYFLAFPACVYPTSSPLIILSTVFLYEFITLLVHSSKFASLICHRVIDTKPSLAQFLGIVLFVIPESIILVGNSQHYVCHSGI